MLSTGALEDRFSIVKEIGRGAFSIVYQVSENKTNQVFALKHLSKKILNKEDLPAIIREIHIMKQIQHQHIITLYEIFETSDSVSIVLEYIPGELFDRITHRPEPFSEKEAANIVGQIMDGLAYLHSKGIAHRDLKPENLLCIGEGPDMVIKIADFGYFFFVIEFSAEKMFMFTFKNLGKILG